MKKNTISLFAVGVLIVALAQIDSATGANVTTNAGFWNDDTIWSLGRRPIAGDDVVVQNAVVLSNTTDHLNSFTITNATLIFTNWTTALNAVTVEVKNNGILALPPAFTTSQMSNRVWVVCSSLTIDTGGWILADTRGYLTENGPGRGYVDSGGFLFGCGGGGYGGMGGSG